MFKLHSTFNPTGDQPQAIESIENKLNSNITHQCLQGVTGSGKTFTMANVINSYNKPVLILSHNKTLAAQLYEEFNFFFPKNSVEYFVSYYDYYQPEAYVPTTNTYIEKDLSINEEIEKFRISTTSSLLSGRKDIIVVASVSCIYGLGNPLFFKEKIVPLYSGQYYERKKLLTDLIEAQYIRTNETNIKRGEFKMIGDTLIIYPSNTNKNYKIHFWGDEIEKIEEVTIETKKVKSINKIMINPSNIFITTKKNINHAITQINNELIQRVSFFKSQKKYDEAERIKSRVNYDIEMIKELGYCNGIENYSRYFDGRKPGQRPFCLLDYFPEDFLLIIDESHVTIPQIRAMHGGDQSRKKTLVDYGYRLPSALENRPLSFDEFESIRKQHIYISATPSDYELEKSQHHLTEQIIRPTGLLEPVIIIEPCKHQIDHLIGEINNVIKKDQRVLVTTLTKKMAERLSDHLIKLGVKCTYIHSDVDTIERVGIMKNLRLGNVDVLVGVNLLREGLDLPEVSLVAIMDADKEGFLRSRKSLIQTIGRAARHIEGKSILYADKITKSMEETIQETNRKRELQKKYNQINNISPKTLIKEIKVSKLKSQQSLEDVNKQTTDITQPEQLSTKELKKEIRKTKKLMNSAAVAMNFIEAAKHRDKMFILQKIVKNRER